MSIYGVRDYDTLQFHTLHILEHFKISVPPVFSNAYTQQKQQTNKTKTEKRNCSRFMWKTMVIFIDFCIDCSM